MTLKFAKNTATSQEVLCHLLGCDATFHPALSSRVILADYAEKISQHAIQFEAWSEGQLAGLVAAYCDDPQKGTAFVSNVSVLPSFTKLGIARQLMAVCHKHAVEAGFSKLSLDVDPNAYPALRLYQSLGFLEQNQAPLYF